MNPVHRRPPRWPFVLAAAALALGALFLPTAHAQEGAPPQGFPDMVPELKKIEGCLGVETAITSSGKNVIFAWFEDKEACLRWYYSDAHQAAQLQLFADRDIGEPMEHVPDEVGPILAIASVTFGKGPASDQLPVGQIAIELYTPLSGGLAIGGRFAPQGLRIPKRKVIVDDE